MMTYKEALFFVAKCLTINHHNENKVIVENNLKSGAIDLDALVKFSTGHFVFPALYCNLKNAGFLHYLPVDLVDYMKHITDLNRERNQQIIEQAKEVNKLLLANNITPVFLKGTGNLLEGLYEDIAERMVGDIDFIVSKDDYLKTISTLKNHDYNTIQENSVERFYHWHYPRLVHPKKIGALEIHKRILKKNYDYLLDFKKIKTDLIKQSGFYFLSTEHKILNAILPKIINDNLYFYKTIQLRTMYDVYLISQKEAYTIQIKNKLIFKKFNNYCGCIKMIFNNPKTINIKETISQLKFKQNYLLTLKTSKKEKNILAFKKFFIKQKDRFEIFIYSFIDKEYREFAMKRIFQANLYKKLLGIKPTL
jgi:hypothetical protein